MRKSILAIVLVSLTSACATATPPPVVRPAAPVEPAVRPATTIQVVDLKCRRGEVCAVLDLRPQPKPAAPVEQPMLVPAAEEMKTEKGDKVPTLVKYFVLPVGTGAIGAGISWWAFPTLIGDGSYSGGAAVKGGIIGVGVGIVSGVILDLLDNEEDSDEDTAPPPQPADSV